MKTKRIIRVLALVLILLTTVYLSTCDAYAEVYHCENSGGVAPDGVQPGDTVYLGANELKSAPVDGVTYVTDFNQMMTNSMNERHKKMLTASYIRDKLKAGLSPSLIASCYSDAGMDYYAVCSQLGIDPNTGKSLSGGGDTAAPTSSSSGSAAPKKKEVSHGVYDAIDDTAETALKALLKEGDENNGYITVKADTEDATITRDTVNATVTAKKDARVEFYAKASSAETEDTEQTKDLPYDQFVYSVTFPQIEVAEDIAEIGLKATYEDLADSQFDDMHALTFATQDIGTEVTVKFHYGAEADQTVYVFTGSTDDDYDVMTTLQADENGDIEFATSTLDRFIVTTTDIVSIREELAKAEAEEQARIEAEQKAEEERKAAEAEAEKLRIEEEEKQRIKEERLAQEVAAEEAARVEAENKQKTTTLIGAGSAVIIAICAVLFLRKRKTRNTDTTDNNDT